MDIVDHTREFFRLRINERNLIADEFGIDLSSLNDAREFDRSKAVWLEIQARGEVLIAGERIREFMEARAR